MSRYVYAVQTGSADGNIPFAAAVLCPNEYLQIVRKELQRLEDTLDVRGVRDVLELDWALASALRAVLPESVGAAAMTVQAWKRGPISGGVIGHPHHMLQSGNDQIEQLAEDVWCIAFPGGPGLLLAGERRLMNRAVQAITTARCLGEDPWPKLKTLMRDAEAYLYVTDGSGANGFLAAGGANGMCSIYLNEEMR